MENKKTICIIGDTPPPISGPEIGVQKLLRSNLKSKYNLRLFSFGLNIKNVSRGKLNFNKIFLFLIKLIQLNGYLKTDKPDYVYYYFTQTGMGLLKDIIIIYVIKRNSRKLILHSRGSNFRSVYIRQYKFYRQIIKKMLNKGDKLLVQSECIKAAFEGIIIKDKMSVFYNFLEENEIHKINISEDPNHYNVLFIGHLSFAKGYYDLLKAIPIVVEQIQNVTFHFAGERIPLNEERNILPKYINLSNSPEQTEQGIDDIIEKYKKYINFLGIITGDKKKVAFLSGNLFVLPSYSEGFSGSVLEAMGCGLPVITTPVGANKDIFARTPNIFVEPGNYIELADKIIFFLKNKSFRQKYGNHNYALVKEKYNMNFAINQFIDVIQKI